MIGQLGFPATFPSLGDIRRKVEEKTAELLGHVGVEGADCVHP
jgi:hypothetical protein